MAAHCHHRCRHTDSRDTGIPLSPGPRCSPLWFSLPQLPCHSRGSESKASAVCDCTETAKRAFEGFCLSIPALPWNMGTGSRAGERHYCTQRDPVQLCTSKRPCQSPS